MASLFEATGFKEESSRTTPTLDVLNAMLDSPEIKCKLWLGACDAVRTYTDATAKIRELLLIRCRYRGALQFWGSADRSLYRQSKLVKRFLTHSHNKPAS